MSVSFLDQERWRRLLGAWMPTLKNAGVVLASVLVAVALMEGFLRLFPSLQVQQDGVYVFCSAEQHRHQPHATFGYTEVPGQVYFEKSSTADPWSFVRINAAGFRDNFDDGQEQVIVLGDSMSRGTLVNENETFSYLLDRWYPDTAFRNFGTGGYGQAQAIRVYEDVGPKLAHRLVIHQISLSTDIDDNVETAEMSGETANITIKPHVGVLPGTVSLPVRIHKAFWTNLVSYRLFYTAAIQPLFGNWGARKDPEAAIELTRRLLAMMAADVRANHADLLLVILPGFNEVAGFDDGMQPDMQREMIASFAAATPGVHMIDLSSRLAEAGPDKTYGKLDKHLTPYGQFLVAEEIDRWILRDWPAGPHAVVPERQFVDAPPIEPTCAMTVDYSNALEHPADP